MAIAGDGGLAYAIPDPVLVKLIVLAFAAGEAAISGKSEPLVDHCSRQHQTRLARLSCLAPDIVDAIVDGRQPPELSGRRLLRIADLPLDWGAQRRLLGSHSRTLDRRANAITIGTAAAASKSGSRRQPPFLDPFRATESVFRSRLAWDSSTSPGSIGGI